MSEKCYNLVSIIGKVITKAPVALKISELRTGS